MEFLVISLPHAIRSSFHFTERKERHLHKQFCFTHKIIVRGKVDIFLSPT